MYCASGFILFDIIGENPCAEHHKSNNRLIFVVFLQNVQTSVYVGVSTF